MTDAKLQRRLGLRESLAITVGSIIGTGVFLKTASMAQSTGSAAAVLLAWFVAGILSFAGALTYAELGTMFPAAGGEYVYLREAYGEMPAFLYGWMRFWFGAPGSIAAYAVGSATFMAGLFPGLHAQTTVAIGLVTTFTLLNCLTVGFAGRVQNLMTAIKVLMILGLAIAVFLSPHGSWQHFGETLPGHGGSGFALAVLAALWAFDGWNNLPMAAGEIRDPSYAIPRALGFGLLAVCGIYALANLAYFYALPLGEIIHSNSSLYPDALPVATKAASVVIGPAAVGLLSAAFVFSALGAMNGSILTGARVPYAMAKDGVFLPQLAKLSPRTQVPVRAVILQGVCASVLAATGTFDQLTNYVVFASWIFYALNGYGLFVFRKRGIAASFRVPFFPILPILFLVSAVLLLLNTVMTVWHESLIGLAFVAAGVPYYFIVRRRSGRPAGTGR